jgi:predicted N-acetyltransferase YhbS
VIETVALNSVRANDVETLLDDAFGADRHQRTAYVLRQGTSFIEYLSFAVLEHTVLVGSIQCWPVMVDQVPLILVGPVAVSPKHQNQGIGRRLMHAATGALKVDDPPTVMIGDPEYYGKFGFVADYTGGWTLPGPWEPDRLLLRNPDNVVLPVAGLLTPLL